MSLLEQFKATLSAKESDILADVRDYAAWQVGRQEADFQPTGSDDVDVRNYLLHLRINRADRAELRRTAKSLQRFYDWAQTEDIIRDNPFQDFDFSRPFLSQEQMHRRQGTLPEDPVERELVRLRSLNELAQQLNRAVDMSSALNMTLDTLVAVMNLQTAWVFVLPNLHRHMSHIPPQPPHDFALAAAVNLPPGLEIEDRRFLCQPGDCHCQWLLRNGRLQRAVNVVECTRMQDASKAKGDTRNLYFHASVPILIDGEALGIVNVATEEWQFLSASDLQFLSTVGAQVAVALERARLYDLSRAQQARMVRELEMAREVQASLLPDILPDISGYSLAAHWQSAREVAGDFYDAFELPNGRIALLVADVSDKGAHAALYMAMVNSLIKTYARLIDNPAAMLTALNLNLVEQNASDMFVTVFFGVLDLETGTITYANAGHDPPMVRRHGGRIEQLPPTGPLIGILDDFQIREKALVIKNGETLLMYTDGVTDALNESGEEYGRNRLQTQFCQAPPLAAACLQYLQLDLDRFMGTAVPSDDITFLILHASS